MLKRENSLLRYEHENLFGQTVYIDRDFGPFLDEYCRLALNVGFEVMAISSFRDEHSKIRGTIVEPATFSNHLAGHALDFNLHCLEGNFHVNSILMKKMLRASKRKKKSALDSRLHYLFKEFVKFKHDILLDGGSHNSTSTMGWQLQYMRPCAYRLRS